MKIVGDRLFLESLRNTVFLAIPSVVLELLIGTGLALLLKRSLRGSSLIKKIIFLPLVFTPVILGIFGRVIFGGAYGMLNDITSLFGIPPLSWLGDPSLARIAVITMNVYMWLPFATLIILASLQAIPKTLFELAETEGASRWMTFRYVTLPLILPNLLIVAILRLIWAFQIFPLPFGLTEFGPGLSTYTISAYIYEVAFREYNFGKGAVMAFLFVFILTIPIMYLTKMTAKRLKK